jgi:hypothetical protein
MTLVTVVDLHVSNSETPMLPLMLMRMHGVESNVNASSADRSGARMTTEITTMRIVLPVLCAAL